MIYTYTNYTDKIAPIAIKDKNMAQRLYKMPYLLNKYARSSLLNIFK